MISDIRKHFPQYLYNPDLCYLDSAASSLTPQCVLDAMNQYYIEYRANVHRGLYIESMRATDEYQRAREDVAQFIGSAFSDEVIFTRGATDGLNMIAEILEDTLVVGQSIVTTVAEHHSNFLPWQQLSQRKEMDLRIVELSNGVIQPEDVVAAIDETTQIVAVSQISNVLGNVLDLSLIRQRAEEVGAVLVVDGCQAVAHLPVDVKGLGADFYVFSGHKMYGPTGIGVVYGRREILEKLTPRRVGGGMVLQVSKNSFEPASLPERFEPGTPPIAEAIGLAAAIKFLHSVGIHRVVDEQQILVDYMYAKLAERPWITLLGSQQMNHSSRIGCFSLIIPEIHSGDVTQVLTSYEIAVRGGHHCAEILSQSLGVEGSTRLSLGMYTSFTDLDRAFAALDEMYQLLK